LNVVDYRSKYENFDRVRVKYGAVGRRRIL